MIRRTWLFKPSARALLILSRMAARIPSRCLRMVLATLTNGASRERLAWEHQRSISSTVSSGVRSPWKIARNASYPLTGLDVATRHGACDPCLRD